MESKLQKLLADDSFLRWMQGTATSIEEKRWNRWYNRSIENRNITALAKQHLESAQFKSATTPDINAEWEKLDARTSASSRRFTFTRYLKYAAIFVMAVLSGVIAWQLTLSNTSTRTVETNLGEKATINLPDGSSITLASNSSLTYSESWLKSDITEAQLSGEAYFNIAKNAAIDVPHFQVHTRNGSVSVWGTIFTVSTRDEKNTRVILEEGDVRLHPQRNDIKDGEVVMMRPGQQALFNRSFDDVQISEVNPALYTSWYSDNIKFDETPISEIAGRVESTYGVELSWPENSGIGDRKVSGAVENTSLSVLLNALEIVLELEFTRDGSTIYLSQKH